MAKSASISYQGVIFFRVAVFPDEVHVNVRPKPGPVLNSISTSITPCQHPSRMLYEYCISKILLPLCWRITRPAKCSRTPTVLALGCRVQMRADDALPCLLTACSFDPEERDPGRFERLGSWDRRNPRTSFGGQKPPPAKCKLTRGRLGSRVTRADETVGRLLTAGSRPAKCKMTVAVLALGTDQSLARLLTAKNRPAKCKMTVTVFALGSRSLRAQPRASRLARPGQVDLLLHNLPLPPYIMLHRLLLRFSISMPGTTQASNQALPISA